MVAVTNFFYDVRVERRGLLVAPNGRADAAEGMLNPAFVQARNGERMLFPRMVAAGNVSRIGRFRLADDATTIDEGYALEPTLPYELRAAHGWGCEDPRVTFVPALDAYIMAYTAYGPRGARIALAYSQSGIEYERLGLVDFSAAGLPDHDDKDAAFFPEPVLSPEGHLSLALYHRPMLHLSAVNGVAAIPVIRAMPYDQRESIRIAYIPLENVKRDRHALLQVRESALVLSPEAAWGRMKVGAGTPPIRVPEGWLSVFHGVDLRRIDGIHPRFSYHAGIVVHDFERPDRVLYRSPVPFLTATEPYECHGVVDNVVFPTGIEPLPHLGERVFDIYYGAADFVVAVARVRLSLRA